MSRLLPFLFLLAMTAGNSVIRCQETNNCSNSVIRQLAGPEKCYEVLASPAEHWVIRRAAFRQLIYTPKTFRKAIELGLKDPDAVIRQGAVYELYRADGEKSMKVLCQMASDPSAEVGKVLAEIGRNMKDRMLAKQLLNLLIRESGSPAVRRLAARNLGFPFNRINIPLSQNPNYDHDVVILKKISLPLDGWAFCLDRQEDGHLNNYFNPGYNDKNWKRISVGKSWEAQGFRGYDGIAWYRLNFKMPARIECLAVELSFAGVDESAWVWLNGKYIGQHDIGPTGWNIPFKLDITKEILWDSENTLAVRVGDTTAAGGIWKPVYLEVIK